MPGVLRNQTGGMLSLGQRQVVDSDFYYDPAYVYNRWPKQTKSERRPDGSIPISIETNDGFAFTMWALSQGPQLRVKKPQSVIDDLSSVQHDC